MEALAQCIVLFGGASGERRVSVASAQHVAALLDAPALWFLAPGGAVHVVARETLSAHARPFETDFDPGAPARFSSLAGALDAAEARGAVFFLALHGGAGEDGAVQAMLEDRGLAFTGSGSAASARAFDKSRAKRAVSAAGVSVAPSVELAVEREETLSAALVAFVRAHGRAIAKPIADGSSVGLHHLTDERSAHDAAGKIAALGVPYLLEAFVRGPELTVGVVDGPGGPRALPASEVRLEPGRVFDFDGKYLGRGTVELTPAQVPEAVSGAARALALAAHRALGCAGYSRTDVIASEAGPVFLETNTLPGLTRASFLPQQLAAEGTSMRAFLDGQLALARARTR